MAAGLLNPRLTGDQPSTNRDIKPLWARFANAFVKQIEAPDAASQHRTPRLRKACLAPLRAQIQA
jgi:hypothetical protein